MDLSKRAQQEAKRLEQKYGYKAGGTGADEYQLNVIPTGSLALDYALGTAGWPRGQVVEVYGAPDIGKSSVIGFNAIRNAQSEGLLCGIVAMEPNFDTQWAIRNGIDPSAVVIGRPDNGEEGFQMLYEWVCGDLVDVVMFDSIGAILKSAEIGGVTSSGGKKEGKPNQGGQSGLITWGIKRILTPAWKNNKLVILLNQQRDKMGSPVPVKDSPGGWALKHSASIRVELKHKGAAYKAQVEGEEIEIGRTLVAVVHRNKMSEGSERRAEFDFYQIKTDDHNIGIDWTKDVINTAIRTRVIEKAGSWFSHPSFPGESHQFQGRDQAAEYLMGNPEAVKGIRQEVLEVMLRKQEERKQTKPKLEVVNGGTGN